MDADNQSAAMCGLLGIVNGLESIPEELMHAVKDTMWKLPFNDNYKMITREGSEMVFNCNTKDKDIEIISDGSTEKTYYSVKEGESLEPDGLAACRMFKKSISILSVILSLYFYLCSQPFGDAASDFRITKLEYENSSGEKGCTYFKYNNDDILYKAFWNLDDKSRSSKNLYEYDSNGWLISAYREFSDGLTSFELFSYDSLGNKISEYFCRSDGVGGSASYQYKDGYLKQADFNNHKGWLRGTLIYQYNEQKKEKSAVLVKDGKTICQVSYEYDDNNNLTKEFWDFQGKWNQTFNYHYEKKDVKKNYYSSPLLTNKSGYRISSENYTFNNETGGPSFYYYDKDGLLYKKVFTRSDSVTTTTFYEYDSERKLIASKRKYSDKRVIVFNYIYDENDNLILRSYNRADTLGGFESYLYNSEGDLIKSYIKNSDNWLTGTIYYNPDETGVITTGAFKGENGFDASIYFNYNNEGLLSEIIWEFTFGKFQKYTFKYESAASP
jgi:hypothetical protein